MAVLTGLSQAFLSMLEAGTRRLTNVDKVVQLLEGLGVPIELTGPMLRTSAPERTSPNQQSPLVRANGCGTLHSATRPLLPPMDDS
ncbi:helix-turn-helix transcriptional regulator [Streptomyces sp. MTZ3.1]|uniref:Helix-turn-helix transcriptional regulator n=2 Tax=Streptomyces meridianus TaxID=2938945 RepID=A0ABT0XBF0_9ACTN|nr:helix-turn-helix transcriptional regulator [Streptomyces meridianus]